MKYNISNEKVKMILDELGEEYKELLIEKLLSEYRVVDIDNLPTSEIIKLDVKVKEKLIVNKKEERRKRFYSMVVLSGILYSFLGVFLLFMNEYLNNFNSNLDARTKLPYIFVFVGMFISFLGVIFKNIPLDIIPGSKAFSMILEDSMSTKYEVVSIWKEIEGLMIQLSPEEKSTSSTNMISYLADSKIINSKEKEIILGILKQRNRIMHSNNTIMMSREEMYTLRKDTKNIIAKLKKLI